VLVGNNDILFEHYVRAEATKQKPHGHPAKEKLYDEEVKNRPRDPNARAESMKRWREKGGGKENPESLQKNRQAKESVDKKKRTASKQKNERTAAGCQPSSEEGTPTGMNT